mgnify:CR=1 FL=1
MQKKNQILFYFTLISILFVSQTISQEIDSDELLERLDRIEKNISDLQRGKFDEIDKSLSSSYISRNESKLGDFETKIRTNFGLVEESNNQIKNLEEKLNLIDKDLQSRIKKIELRLKKFNEKKSVEKKSFLNGINQNQSTKSLKDEIKKKESSNLDLVNKQLNEDQIKKKYENAIKLLWANKYEKAEEELIQLKNLKPKDLMPNIQYWLGEVYYAKKNFQQAVLEFGEGFTNYPDSIKGPDNLLKLGLSFSNLNQKNEACSAFYELEIKYKNSPKNVIERSQEERKKLNCPKE